MIKNGGKLVCMGPFSTARDAAIGYDCGLVGSNKPSSCYNFPPFEVEEEEDEEEEEEDDDGTCKLIIKYKKRIIHFLKKN